MQQQRFRPLSDARQAAAVALYRHHVQRGGVQVASLSTVFCQNTSREEMVTSILDQLPQYDEQPRLPVTQHSDPYDRICHQVHERLMMLSRGESSGSPKHLVMVARADTVAAQYYEWMPCPMPPGIRVLISAVDKSAIHVARRCRSRLHRPSLVKQLESSQQPSFPCKDCGRHKQDQGAMRLLCQPLAAAVSAV